MPTQRPKDTRLLRALSLAIVLGACLDATDPSTTAHVTLEVRELSGVRQGDFTSVVDRVDLTIMEAGDGGVAQALSQPLAPDESEGVFEVELDDGDWTFLAESWSTNETLLYRGETDATIDADGFDVTIVPQAVSPVLVVQPRRPQIVEVPLRPNEIFFYSVSMLVVNSGLDGLTWRVDSLTTRPGSCFLRLDRRDCLVDIDFAGGEADTAVVVTTEPPLEGIHFIANVGTLTVPTAP